MFFRKRSWIVVAIIATMATLLTAGIALAFQPSYEGDLTGGQFRRPYDCEHQQPSGGYHYDSFSLHFSEPYDVTFETVSSHDTFMVLYQGSFDPSQPLAHCYAADDDAGTGFNSLIHARDLNPGNYTVVVTSYTAGEQWNYRLKVYGLRGEGEVPVTIDDGRINSGDLAAPIAVYPEDDSYAVFGIDPNTGDGTLAFEVTPTTGETTEPVVLQAGVNPYSGQPITMYWLPSGEFQINTYYADGKPYIITWPLGGMVVYHPAW